MPSPNVMLVAVLGSLLYFGAVGVVHGVKKAAHKIGCMVEHGRTCLTKK
jgi:hypothetical protein